MKAPVKLNQKKNKQRIKWLIGDWQQVDPMRWQEWLNAAKDPSKWRDHHEKGLLKAEHVRDYVLRLWLEEDMDVSIYELDFYPLIMEEDPGPVLRPMRSEDQC